MNKLTKEEQVRVVACLVEGNSLRATSRMTGTHRTAIQKLLVELGVACSAYQDKAFWSTTIIPFHRRQLFLSSDLGKFSHLFGVMIAPVRWNGVFGASAPMTAWNRTGGGFMVGSLPWLFAPGHFRR